MAKKKVQIWQPNPNLGEDINRDDISDYVLSDSFTANDYVDILTGRYPHIDPTHGYGYHLKQVLTGNIIRNIYDSDEDYVNKQANYKGAGKQNTKVNNDKVLNRFRGLAQTTPKQTDEFETLKDNYEHFIEYYNLGDKAISSMVSLENPNVNVLKNKNFTKSHLYKFVENHPEHMDRAFKHDHWDDALEDKVFADPDKLQHMQFSDIRSMVGDRARSAYSGNADSLKEDWKQHTKLTEKRSRQILESFKGNDLEKQVKTVLLDHVDPTYRKQFLDKKLGLHGAEYSVTPEGSVDEEDFNEENWQNVSKRGEEHKSNEGWGDYLAGSRHIDDDQAEFIKRHGDFPEKYALYENKHADPKHGAEMFKKWYDEDEDHGYIADELNTALSEDYSQNFSAEDLPEDAISQEDEEEYRYNAAEQYAIGSYNFENYINDNVENIWEGKDLDNNHLQEINEKLHRDYNWTGENTNYNKDMGSAIESLLKIAGDDKEGDGDVHPKHIQEYDKQWGANEGAKLKSYLEDYSSDNFDENDPDDYYSESTLIDDFIKVNPKEVNYADNKQKLNIRDHPEYDSNFEEAKEEWGQEKTNNYEYPEDFYEDQHYEDYRQSEGLQEDIQANVDEWKEEKTKEYFKEHFSNAGHQDPRVIPSHLHDSIPNFQELKESSKKLLGEGPNGPFFNKHIPDRDYEHEYGVGQHHHEMLIDYANAKKGSIDAGTMHKMYPNLKDTWKHIFAGKGKLSTEEIQQKIDQLPKNKYEISYGKWDSGKMQNLNGRNEIVFRLDHSDDSVKPLKEDPETYAMFEKVQNVSQRSGHPTKKNTIGWARVDTNDPKHWFIDEQQSDFGKTVTRYLKNEGHEDKAGHVDKIAQHHKDWREALTNFVVKMGKKHGVEKISTHSPESKSKHTDSEKKHTAYRDGYQKVPRRLGFKPSKVSHLPLTEKGKKVFSIKDKGVSGGSEEHSDAHEHHTQGAKLFTFLGQKERDKDKQAALMEFGTKHQDLANAHAEKAKGYSASWDSSYYGLKGEDFVDPDYATDIEKYKKAFQAGKPEPHEGDKLLSQKLEAKSHGGHTMDLTPQFFKKNLDLVINLIKNEVLLNSLTPKTIYFRNKLLKNIEITEELLGYCSRPNKYLKKLGLLRKGSLQSKMKFNPLSEVNQVKIYEQRKWTHGESQEVRKQLKPMEGASKKRALNKLHARTEVRKHPTTNERIFLMHRGMDDNEYDNENDHVNGKTKYHAGVKTSWTPHFEIAEGFGRRATVSAWIPESSLTYNPNQFNAPSKKNIKERKEEYPEDNPNRSPAEATEHEWIVSHEKQHHHANMDAIASKNKLNWKINRRATKLAASEKDTVIKESDIEKGAGKTIAQGAALITMMHGAYELGGGQKDAQEQAAQKISQPQAAQARSVASTEHNIPHEANKGSEVESGTDFGQKRHMLNAISQVESSGGKNTKHDRLPASGIHKGGHAYGEYGLTPILIKETIKKHPDLMSKHGDLTKYRGQLFHDTMKLRPELEHEIASRHYDRLAKQFENNTHKIAFSWLSGIRGTHRADKMGISFKNHWHVKKVMKAYNQSKNKIGK